MPFVIFVSVPKEEQTTTHKVGAPYGNQNARKHGYYSRHLGAGKDALRTGSLVEGLDAEIALLRAKVKEVARKEPGNFALISRGVLAISRLLVAKQKLLAEVDAVSAILPDF